MEEEVEDEEEDDDDDSSPNSSVWYLRGLFLVGKARGIFLFGAIEKTLEEVNQGHIENA